MESIGRCVLICSGSFCNIDLRSEVGYVPPCFLPIKNKRLFQLQFEVIKKTLQYDSLIISLPDEFEIANEDRNIFEKSGAEICRVDDKLQLGRSIFSVLHNKVISSLIILHGDTLPIALQDVGDSVLVGEPKFEYHWDSLESESNGAVLAGFFCFADGMFFKDCLVAESYDFFNSVRLYDSRRPLRQIDGTGWMDFGHAFSYLSSRAQIATSRAFNELSIQDGYLEKKSANRGKLFREFCWYRSVPRSLRVNIPAVQEIRENDIWIGYSTEYLPLVGLNEVWVYGSMPQRFWETKIRLLLDLLTKLKVVGTTFQSHKQPAKANTWRQLIEYKTADRMREIDISEVDWHKNYKLNGRSSATLQEIQSVCLDHLMDLEPAESFFHGDFCLSNLFVDQRTNQVKMIDPRGIGEDDSPLGPDLYDIGKLCHSIIGDYDYILADRFSLRLVGRNIEFEVGAHPNKFHLKNLLFYELQKRFGYTKRDVIALIIILFQSMVPLHYDNSTRQYAFLVNSVRLFEEFHE